MQAMATETFIDDMRGPVIGRTDADYDAVRSLYNGMIDKTPVIIARCTDVADIVTAVNFARQNDLRVAIRGGGHNGPGLGTVDDGLMIDLSMMKGVRVNSTARTVRVAPRTSGRCTRRRLRLPHGSIAPNGSYRSVPSFHGTKER
jgi:FAD/FMN-containing dehydrogenase